MTICTTLRETTTQRGYKVTAQKEEDKTYIFVNGKELLTFIPHYWIHVSKDGIGVASYKTAKTTYKKKFNEVVTNW